MNIWVKATKTEELKAKRKIVVRIEEKQILLLRNANGQTYAINNRCPHEGFPLSEGTMQGDCVLACNWHGWTFELDTGTALQGRDAVRTYPVRENDGWIEIDIADASAEVRQQASWQEFWEAFAEHDYDRMARSLVRYSKAGGAPETFAVEAILRSVTSLERGLGHAHAGLADWLYLMRDDHPEYFVGLLEALGHFSWDSLFSQETMLPKKSADWTAALLRQAIEDMDQERALSLCQAATGAGVKFADLAPVFKDVIFSHYAGFGHPAIYLEKATQLIARLGEGVDSALCLLMTRYLCLAAREDQIPEFKEFSYLMTQTPVDGQLDETPTATEIAGISVRTAIKLVDMTVLSERELWERFLAASAISMLRFDLQLQDKVNQSVAQNVGWLDFTHAITFSEALLNIAKVDASVWRSGLMQQACFLGRNSKFLMEAPAQGFGISDSEVFLQEQKKLLLNMDEGQYIFAVHRLKMVVAIEKLLPDVSQETQELLLTALNRYLSTRTRQRHPARSIYQAQRIVDRE